MRARILLHASTYVINRWTVPECNGSGTPTRASARTKRRTNSRKRPSAFPPIGTFQPTRVRERRRKKKTTTEERKKKRKLKQNRDKNSDSTNWSFCYFRSTCVQLTYFMVMPLHDFELLRDRRYTSREVYFYCIIFFRVIISYLQNASATKYCNRNFINKTGKKSRKKIASWERKRSWNIFSVWNSCEIERQMKWPVVSFINKLLQFPSPFATL